MEEAILMRFALLLSNRRSHKEIPQDCCFVAVLGFNRAIHTYGTIHLHLVTN